MVKGSVTNGGAEGSNAPAAGPKGFSCIRRLRSSQTVARPAETPIKPKRSKGEPAQVRGGLEGELGWAPNDLSSAIECAAKQRSPEWLKARGGVDGREDT